MPGPPPLIQRAVEPHPSGRNKMHTAWNARRTVTVALAATLVSAAAAACSSAATTSTPSSSSSTSASANGLVVYYIPKDTQNPYEVIADQCVQTALQALGGKVVVSSGTQDTAAAPIPSIHAAIQAHASAIVVAGNDPSPLCPSLAQAPSPRTNIVAF